MAEFVRQHGRLPPGLVEVIEGCLKSDPDERMSLEVGLQALERVLYEDRFDDAELELCRVLIDPAEYLNDLPGRMVAMLVHETFAAMETDDRGTAARSAERALAWRPGDPVLVELLRAVPTTGKDQVKALRARLAPHVEATGEEATAKSAEKKSSASTTSKGRSRWRRGVAGGVIIGLIAATAGLVARVRDRPAPLVQKVFASVVKLERPGPVQFTYRLLSEYRRYPIDDAGRKPPAELRLDLDALDALKKAGDLHAVCSAWVADGSPGTLEHAQACLDVLAPRTEERGIVKLAVSPSPKPDIDSDRAAILLILGKPDQALWLIAGVLAARPDHPAAAWNRALALQGLGLTVSAAEAFERIEGRGIPGWSKEASERKEALLRVDGARRRAYEDVIARGRAMVAGGAIPLDLARTFPGYLRLYLYDAVRAAASAERVRALLPLAEELDRVQGGNGKVLASYVRRIAQAPFDRRGPLAETYGRLVADYNALDAQAQGDYFARLRAAGEEDLLLGALVLTGRVGDHLAEYRNLAQRSGDPWFIVLAETEQAQVEMARGEYRQAEGRLRATLAMGERQGVAYRYLRTELSLVRLYLSLYALTEAEAHAKVGLTLARQTGDWAAETQFLGELFELSQLRNARPLAAAYLDETGKREAESCRRQRYVHENRALMHFSDLRFEEARREIVEAPLCGEPRSLTSVTVLAELVRMGIPVEPAAQLREDLVTLRRGPLKPGDQAFVEYVEGLLRMKHDPQEGRLHLQRSIALTEGMPTLDAKAREARVHAYEELSLAAGQAGDADGALLPLAQEAGIPLPTRCVLGAVAFGERSLVALRDHNGVSRLLYEGHRTSPNLDVAQLVPIDSRVMLSGCPRVDVLLSPVLRGRPELLSYVTPWTTRARHRVPTGSARCQVHQLEVRDAVSPSDLRLPRFSTGGSELLSNADRTVLWGATATPEAVLAALPKASEILIAAQAFAADGAASLLLSQGEGKKYTLTLDDLEEVELACAPVVALILSPAEATALGPQAPRNPADVLIERGARAVFTVMGPVPGSEYRQFFGILFAQIQAGAPVGEALNDVKNRWIMWNRDSQWVARIVLFE